MARGIITKKPAGTTTAGRIIVTNAESAGVISGGGTDTGAGTGGDAVGASPVSIENGQGVDFTEANANNVGDIVDFVFDGQLGSGLQGVGKATVITGNYTDNVVVGAGQNTVIIAGNLEGKISVNGGTLVIAGNTFIAGKVESAVADSSILVDNGTTIEGKIEMSALSTLVVRNSTIEGKLSANGLNYVCVKGCTVRGKLEVLNSKTCKCTGNTVQGQTNTPGCQA